MSVRETSIKTYYEIIGEGLLGEAQKIVFLAFKEHENSTDREIADFLGKKDPNVVRPRRRELVLMGCLEEVGKRECLMTGRTAIIWNIPKNIQFRKLISKKINKKEAFQTLLK